LDSHPADRLTRAARAAQALSETLWEALQEELSDPCGQHVAELSEQLGEVAAILVSLAWMEVRGRGSGESAMAAGRGAPAVKSVASAGPRSRDARVLGEPFEPREPFPPSGPASHVARAMTYGEPSSEEEELAPPGEPPETQASPSPAVLIDELAPAEFEPPASTAPEFSRAPASPPLESSRSAHRPIAGTRPREGDPPRKVRPQIEIRDVRGGEEGPAAWIGSIGRRLERREQDGLPFAVLLVELVDLERLHDPEPSGEVSRLTGHVEDALARELRPADSLTRERPGRYWLLAPQTDGPGAQVLLERIARAVRSSASHRGTPLEVAVGVAVCPEDGLRASELAAHADVGLYAARAAGRSSIR
jgi:GGDEF domain-containing protein